MISKMPASNSPDGKRSGMPRSIPKGVELLNILATYGGEIGEEKSFAEIMGA
jgi:hypothetical protein